ncbi:MAG: type II toxin-antitoxin system RelE/ParE family toxin [Clostridia bacterium]|nr:type II toxin-antitoxin system RelE/ParE family toxin [Clostridia bacterium]MBQ8368814.1 type II toxin-antitoxin system RelE/ParE family toxin [Clostridia bacterium]MBQ8511705.1 type II toxin-antitoxin system RelE/ParE family toxin [Clostridia bacterium]
MRWEVVYIKEAQKDLRKLDPQSRKFVLKAIEKVSANPLPNSEGGYGKPLGNHRSSKLAGYMKIKLRDLGLRVVYGLVRENNVMKIIIISIRDDDAVYIEAAARIHNEE